MIKDWNRNEVNEGEVFHFKNSLEPFIYLDAHEMFLDIHTWLLYDFEELDRNGYAFYRLEEDEDFYGVEIDGRIEWVE